MSLRAGLIVIALTLSGHCLAQTTSTEILGTVTDSSGAVVPQAKVTLLRVATGETRETTSTSNGDYSFPLIEIGEYKVTAQAAGFRTQEKTGITLQLQQKARVNFEMTVGETRETVEIVASAVQLKTEDASVGQVIDNRRVVELPLNGRNISGLAVLTPGVQFAWQRTGVDGSGGQIPGRMVQVSANGQRGLNQQVTMDGVSITGAQVNMVAFTPSIDAIEEFKVQTSSYSAEYGQQSGAQVQIAMKAGTNRFRATLFEFLRNDSLAAKDYFLNFQLPAGTRPGEKNRLRRNQFGSFVSGPVYIPKLYDGRNRTFWSFNYEGLRETRETVREAFWFPEEFRRGDFSALLTPLLDGNGRAIRAPIIIFDPLTGDPFRDANGQISNIIPPSRINRNAQNFLNQYQPLPMFRRPDILDNNVTASVPTIITSNQVFFRIDHNFSQNDKVFVRWIGDKERSHPGDINPYFPRTYEMNPANWATQWIHIFNPRILNEARFGWYHSVESNYSSRSNTDFDIDSLGIGQFRMVSQGNRKLTPRETGIPDTIIGGDRDRSEPGFADAQVYQINDNFAVVQGAHSFKIGFDWRHVMLDAASSNSPRGGLGCCPGGYNLAGWLLGYLNSSQTPEGLAYNEARQNRWSLYFQDEWRATRKLTVNMGVRWDYFAPPYDNFGGWRNLRLDILSTGADGRQYPTYLPEPYTKGVSLTNPDNRYVMPRLGLAYRLTDKWVLRSGFGWFANAQQLENFNIIARNPPNGGFFTFNQVTDTAQVIPYTYAGQTFNIQTRRVRAGTDVLTLSNPFPLANPATRRLNLTLLPPDNKYSSHVQWSFDIQRALPWNVFLTVAYVGSKTSHIDNNWANFNNPDPSPDTNFEARRPYQAFVSQGEGNAVLPLSSIRYLDSYADARYHALQVTAEKRYSNGLTMGLAYTYGKALGVGGDRNGGDPNYQNPRDRRSELARYPFDVTHNAVINYVYEMPFLNRFKGVVGAFLGGWQTNGIVTLRTGFPFTPNGGNLNGGPNSVTRPDRIADGRIDDPTRAKYFDPAAFRRTECNIPGRLDLCHYGNAGPYILLTPGAKNFDLSLFKNWSIPAFGDSSRLQFRAESFNTFNTPQFGVPNNIGWASNDSIIPDTPRMGEIRTLRLPMRVIQFGLKLYF